MKQWIDKLNAQIEQFSSSIWGRRLRISAGVTWNLILIFAIFIVAAGLFATAVGAGYFASLIKEEPLRSSAEMREQIFNYEETSEIYFANEVYIGKLRTDLERRETSLSAVSPNVTNAVLATEDEYFREHTGILPKAVIRGLLQDMTNSSTQTGGSTLTQQLIKNQILTNEVSYERKAKEILLAMRLEHFMTKEEILESYLNIIPYGRNAAGNNIAGIATAAEGIFGVSPADLNLAQAAYIAGIPQAPFKYTPFTQTGELKDEAGLQPGIDRMKTVLYRMHEVGYITKEEYEQTLQYDIVADFRKKEPRANEIYPWLTAEIESRAIEIMSKILAERDGIDPKRLAEEKNLLEKYTILADRDIRSSGYRIYSTIDKTMYDKMNDAAKNFKSYGHTYTETVINEDGIEEKIQIPVQVGSVMMENATGRIISFVGGRDFEVSQVNHATQAFRSNGSTMKPLLAYAPALEYGIIGAGSPLVDVKFRRSDGYAPKNFLPNEERGIMPAREALAYSQNLPVLRLYDSILDRKPATFLEKMGFTKLHEKDYTNLSTSIGGLEVGSSVEENTNAYATFANKGQFIDAYMIDKIVDLDGNVIYEHEVVAEPVFSPETAYMMTDMLRDVLDYGTGQRAQNMLKFSSDFAGKTGTSQQFRDVWFIGYNPNVTLGVWLGYEKQRSLSVFNGTYNQPSVRVNMLWATLMNAAYDANKELIDAPNNFQKPEGVVTASFCGISGLAPSAACQSAGLVRSDLFNRAFLPSKADDSFGGGSALVEINGKYYQALPSTPSEFISGSGVGLNANFAQRMLGRLGGDPSKLLPNHSSLGSTRLSGSVFNADGAAPAAVTATLNGSTMSWSRSGSGDVIGYRVYDVTNGARSLVRSVRGSSGNSASVPSGRSYAVVAVDITGLESGLSNAVTFNVVQEPPKDESEVEPPAQAPAPTPPPEAVEKPKPEKPKPEKPKPTPPAETTPPPADNTEEDTETPSPE